MLKRDLSRRAKIVATLGPSSQTVEQISDLILAGLDIARVNMSHGTHEGHADVIRNIREASKRVNKEVAILLDLQGPKIRVDKLPTPLILTEGEEWVIGATSIRGQFPEYNDRFIPTIYENLVKDAKDGCTILFDDGLLEAKAISKDREVLKIKIIVGGELKSNKGINLPDINVSAESFTEKDKKDLFFGLSHNIDYVALSFVRRKEDILKVKYILHELKTNIPIVSKIERPEAIINIEEIIQVSDAIMVARGDMGVELGNHLVPTMQKRIITLCNQFGRPVITATQMLESMIVNTRPTRAEATDVANAIWDGTDALMLSAETASGKNPVVAIKTMEKIIKEAERIPKIRPQLSEMDLSNVSASLQVAASLISEKVGARWIISFTQSGNSCFKLSRFRPKVRILGVTNSLKAMRKMCLLWGVTPYLIQGKDEFNTFAVEKEIIAALRDYEPIENGDKVVITYGDRKVFDYVQSNTVRVEIIKDNPKANRDSDLLDVATTEKGQIVLDTHICASCQNCVEICPHEIWAVGVSPMHNTFINKVNASQCTFDQQCVEVCPTGAIEFHLNE